MIQYLFLPVMVVSGVGHFAERAVRLQQRIFSLDNVSITSFVLRFVVTSVGIFDGV